MKSTLRFILGWLDRKFPDQVVVTQENYNALIKRIEVVEKEVTKFNVTWGYGGGMNPANGQPATRVPFTR